jgi:hypothetical protein
MRFLGQARWRFAALALMVLLIAGARVHTFDEPLEPDLVTYATIGHEMVSGERLYRDVWDLKPPGLYATYAVAETIVGHGPREVFFLGVLAALTTLAAVYAAGCVFGVGAGLWAAAFWTALSGTLLLQANQPNAEVFINALCMGAFALLVRQGAWPGRGGLALAGALFALASTYKQVAVVPALLVLAAHVGFPPPGRSRKVALGDAVVFGAAGAGVWAAVFAYAAAVGQATLYWATIVTVHGDRAAGGLFNLYRYLREGWIFPSMTFFLLPLLLLVAVAAVRGLRGPNRREWALFVALVLGTHAMIFLQGGAFHPHSYQFWLPVAALGAGWAVATVAGDARMRVGRLSAPVGVLAAAACLLVVLAHELPNNLRPPEEWARRKYGPRPEQDRAAARALAAVLRPDETLFFYGDGAALYFYTGLRPSTPTLWSSHLLRSSPLTDQVGAATMAQLKATPPDLFVVQEPAGWASGIDPEPETSGLAARLLGAGPPRPVTRWDHHPLYLWAIANYRPWPSPPPQAHHLTLYVRPGTPLDRRLPRN